MIRGGEEEEEEEEERLRLSPSDAWPYKYRAHTASESERAPPHLQSFRDELRCLLSEWASSDGPGDCVRACLPACGHDLKQTESHFFPLLFIFPDYCCVS